jgi:hypothetical protein
MVAAKLKMKFIFNFIREGHWAVSEAAPDAARWPFAS